MWVIDWYNYIVQHNPTPAGFKTGRGAAYETPLRDKTHGRIYRIVWDGAGPQKPPRLDTASPAELVATLKRDNLWWRQTAQRLLVERGKADVAADLAAIVRDQAPAADSVAYGAAHALWTLHGLGALTADVLTAGLNHCHPAPRRAALGVVPRTA